MQFYWQTLLLSPLSLSLSVFYCNRNGKFCFWRQSILHRIFIEHTNSGWAACIKLFYIFSTKANKKNGKRTRKQMFERLCFWCAQTIGNRFCVYVCSTLDFDSVSVSTCTYIYRSKPMHKHL